MAQETANVHPAATEYAKLSKQLSVFLHECSTALKEKSAANRPLRQTRDSLKAQRQRAANALLDAALSLDKGA